MIKYNEIDLKTLLSNATSTKSVFLCGNGFSINFDENYRSDNLASRLYKIHCYLKTYDSFDVISNPAYKRVFTENYKAVKKALRLIKNQDSFSHFFHDAYAFACSIIENTETIEWLNDNGYNSHLVFGLCQLDLVRSIIEQANKKGIMYVNYEYWTVLIYYVLALSTASPSVYSFDDANTFVSAVKSGGTLSPLNESLDSKNILLIVSANGMFTYFRLLFTANILLEGKSYNVMELSRWSFYNIDILNHFLSNFDFLLTTNYDRLLETITGSDVAHLHGAYSKEKKRVLSVSLGVFYNLVRYDLTTAVIGDYFLSKSFIQVAAKNASKQKQNSDIEIYSDILKRIIKEEETQTIVIFGLNMDNDLHILRDIQIFLQAGNINRPHIVYCYYCDGDKQGFLTEYEACITYSNELNDYVRNCIEVSVIDSKKLIEEIFVKI